MNSYSVNLQFVPIESVRLLLILASVVGISMGGALFWLVKDISEARGLNNRWFDRFEWKFSELQTYITSLEESVDELSDKLKGREEEKE